MGWWAPVAEEEDLHLVFKFPLRDAGVGVRDISSLSISSTTFPRLRQELSDVVPHRAGVGG